MDSMSYLFRISFRYNKYNDNCSWRLWWFLRGIVFILEAKRPQLHRVKDFREWASNHGINHIREFQMPFCVIQRSVVLLIGRILHTAAKIHVFLLHA